MRSFIVALVPALALSLSVIACSADSDNTNEPDISNNQSQLVAEGGECDDTNPCQTGLFCAEPGTNVSNISVRGLAAPCSTDCNPTPTPAPTTTTAPPTPAPAPTTTTPATPQPFPAKVCIAPAK